MTTSRQAPQVREALDIRTDLGNGAQLLVGNFRVLNNPFPKPEGTMQTESGATRIEFSTELHHEVAGFDVPLAFEIRLMRPRTRFYVSPPVGGYGYFITTDEDNRPNRTPGITTLWVTTHPMIAVQSVHVVAYGRTGITNANLKELAPNLDLVTRDAILTWAKWDFAKRHPGAAHQTRTARLHALISALDNQLVQRESEIDLDLVARLANEAKTLGRPTGPYVAAQMGLKSKNPNNYARQLIHQARKAGLDVGDSHGKR
jgi:hypothetical protein